MSSHRIDFPDKAGAARHWPAAIKEEIVLATLEAGATVASVARRYDLDPSQIYQWRKALGVSRLPLKEGLGSTDFLPVHLCGGEAEVALSEVKQEEAACASGPGSALASVTGSSSTGSGMIEIQVGLLHRVRVCNDFACDTLDRVLDVLRRHR